MSVVQLVGKAVCRAFDADRAGVIIAGLEVPHCHIHVAPIRGVHDLDFGNQDPNPDPGMMDASAQTLRTELRNLGYREVSD